MPWDEAHMKQRRLHAWHSGGDRRDVLAIDGNAKLYRHTYGAPCAQSVHMPSLDCPHKQEVLCSAHAALRSHPQLSGEIATHRVVDALTEGGYYGLQVQIKGFAPRWQAACTAFPDVTMTMTMTYSHEVSNVNQELGPTDMSAGVMTPHRKNLMSVRLVQRARETLVLCSRQCTESRVRKDQQAFAETNSI